MTGREPRTEKGRALRRALFALAGVAVLMTPNLGRAAVEANTSKTYVITPGVGPWLICVATYSGPESRQLANELALEIRRRDNLPAYIFDRADEQRRQHAEE